MMADPIAGGSQRLQSLVQGLGDILLFLAGSHFGFGSPSGFGQGKAGGLGGGFKPLL